MAAVAATVSEFKAFFESLRRAGRGALLLDYDGTLAPFQMDRQAALPYLGISELLTSIMAGPAQSRVALVTGRPAREHQSLLPFEPAPEIWGSHGLERLRPDGSYEIPEIPREAVELLTGVDERLRAEGLEAIMELKPGATAVHWRNLSKRLARDVRERILRLWSTAPQPSMLFLAEFDGGMEFRLRLRNKGDAVQQILAELQDSTPVAYLGDDHTDEDAFHVLKERGLSVLVSEHHRPTAADVWIQPPQGVLSFLTEWLRACGKVH